MLRPTLVSTIRLNAITTTNKRAFSLLNPKSRSHTNRVFDPVRQPNDLHTLTLLNAADNRSLITLWTASWCQTCQAIKPLIKQLVEEEKIGEREGGLGFVEVMMGDGVGWDTHQNNFPRTRTLSQEADAGMAALLDDLKSRGLLDETLVLIGGEFG